MNNLHLQVFSYNFWSPELRSLRKEYFKIIFRTTALVILLMWCTLPAYWGALSNSAVLTENLEAWFIDRDGSLIGDSLWAVFGNKSTSAMHLGWKKVDPAVIGTDEDVKQAIVHEKAWIAVVVESDATTRLSLARESGDSTYNPNSAITVYYNQGRNEIAAANFIIPITTALLQSSCNSYATFAAQRYLTQIRTEGVINVTAVELLVQAPMTLSPAIGWTMVNLRPYTAPVATAVTLVGQIFICIFTFMTTMANATARALVQHYLRFPSYLSLRLVIPLLMYLPLSFSYALVNLAFSLPFGAKYTYAGGFFLFFVYVYLAMAALGLALESMITLLTPKFVPFFLFTLIVYNVSAAALPNELQSTFFRYGNGFLFCNLSIAIRTIIFNTYSYLGVNAAVLVGWVILSCFILAGFTWVTRRYDQGILHMPTIRCFR